MEESGIVFYTLLHRRCGRAYCLSYIFKIEAASSLFCLHSHALSRIMLWGFVSCGEDVREHFGLGPGGSVRLGDGGGIARALLVLGGGRRRIWSLSCLFSLAWPSSTKKWRWVDEVGNRPRCGEVIRQKPHWWLGDGGFWILLIPQVLCGYVSKDSFHYTRTGDCIWSWLLAAYLGRGKGVGYKASPLRKDNSSQQSS